MLGIGLVGAFVGGGIGYTLAGLVGYFLGAVIVATLLIVAYRRFVQHRGITGPEAQERPTRGFGIRRRP
jgi:membrane protein implicated in regulation of membrane protease activity